MSVRRSRLVLLWPLLLILAQHGALLHELTHLPRPHAQAAVQEVSQHSGQFATPACPTCAAFAQVMNPACSTPAVIASLEATAFRVMCSIGGRITTEVLAPRSRGPPALPA